MNLYKVLVDNGKDQDYFKEINFDDVKLVSDRTEIGKIGTRFVMKDDEIIDTKENYEYIKRKIAK